MSLKKLLWNDNASELLGRTRDRSDSVVSEPPGADAAARPPYTARKLLKGSAAFTSALLFGTDESQGLVRTLGEATADASKTLLKSQRQTDIENSLRSHEAQQNENKGTSGIDGPGYYGGGSGYYDNPDYY